MRNARLPGEQLQGENICHVCVQQLNSLILVLVQLKKSKVSWTVPLLPECYQTLPLITLSFSSVHLCVFVRAFVDVCGMFLASQR